MTDQSKSGPERPVTGNGQGRSLIADDLEPWSEPVDGAALLDELATTIRRYVVLDAAHADATALWIMHTHAMDAATISPRLAITSPEKRCGKTTLLLVLSGLVARPKSAANLTSSTLFRLIDAIRPTLLIDEADTFLAGKDEMRGIINAGHMRNGTVMRSVKVGDDWQPREFPVWSAMAIAAIGKLPGTVEDRAVSIELRRRRPDEVVERLRIDRLDQFKPFVQRALRWAMDNLAVLSDADPNVPSELHDRAADNWRPLLAIADVAGGEWPERARRAAIAMSRRDAEADYSDAHGILLLSDLRELFSADNSGVLFTNGIVSALHSREDRPWPEYQRGRPITSRQMATLLKPFGITTNQTVRRGNRTAKGYKSDHFADAWARYLSPETAVTGSQGHSPQVRKA